MKCCEFRPVNPWFTQRLLVNFFGMLTSFSIIHRKKMRKHKKKEKNTHQQKKVVYQCLGVTLKSWLTPKPWSTPGVNKQIGGSIKGWEHEIFPLLISSSVQLAILFISIFARKLAKKGSLVIVLFSNVVRQHRGRAVAS